MFKRVLLACLMLGFVGAIFADNSSATAQVATNDSNKAPVNTVLTSKQPIYTLHLKSNPTTGYSWFVVSYPDKYVKLTKHAYLPPSSKLMGAGGYDLWQFSATPAAFLAPRVIKIRLMYARPWEINSKTPVQTFYAVTQS